MLAQLKITKQNYTIATTKEQNTIKSKINQKYKSCKKKKTFKDQSPEPQGDSCPPQYGATQLSPLRLCVSILNFQQSFTETIRQGSFLIIVTPVTPHQDHTKTPKIIKTEK